MKLTIAADSSTKLFVIVETHGSRSSPRGESKMFSFPNY
jgi:hypothetical protein